MKFQSYIPNQIWISPKVHLLLTAQKTSHVGLLYGATLPTHIQITHFLQYPSLPRQQLQNWQKAYEKQFLRNQDTQKVGWYVKGKKERSYEELESCKSYQKCLEQSFFLMVDSDAKFPYHAYRLKRSFLNREVFSNKQLDKINPFNQLSVKIKGAVNLSSDSLIFCEQNRSSDEKVSNKVKLIYSLIEATTQSKKLPTKNDTMIEEQFTEQLAYNLTYKQCKNKLNQEQYSQKEAQNLLNDLWNTE